MTAHHRQHYTPAPPPRSTLLARLARALWKHA